MASVADSHALTPARPRYHRRVLKAQVAEPPVHVEDRCIDAISGGVTAAAPLRPGGVCAMVVHGSHTVSVPDAAVEPHAESDPPTISGPAWATPSR